MSALLDAKAEAALWLADNKKLSNKEIARQMNMSDGAVSNALKRARKRSGMDPRAGHRESDAGGRAKRKEPIDDSIIGSTDDRTPCVRCGTRRDRHAEFGCRRWVAL